MLHLDDEGDSKDCGLIIVDDSLFELIKKLCI